MVEPSSTATRESAPPIPPLSSAQTPDRGPARAPLRAAPGSPAGPEQSAAALGVSQIAVQPTALAALCAHSASVLSPPQAASLPSWLPQLDPASTACFVDTETTGLSVSEDRVLELAAACFRPDGSEIGAWSAFVRGSVAAGAEAVPGSQVHGITAAMLAGGVELKEALDVLDAIVRRSRCVAGHNVAEFDIPILEAEAARLNQVGGQASGHPLGGALRRCPRHDTLLAARRQGFKPAALGAVYLRLFGESHEAHRALADARASARCHFRLAAMAPAPAAPQEEGPRLYLRAAFEQKERVKELGGLWDPQRRLWYAPREAQDALLKEFPALRDVASAGGSSGFTIAGEDRTFGGGLRVEPRPAGAPLGEAWQLATGEAWEHLKFIVSERAGNRCELCGSQLRWTIISRYSYQVGTRSSEGVQRLERLISACADCREVAAMVPGRAYPAALREHLQKVGQMTAQSCDLHLRIAFGAFAERSKLRWTADASILKPFMAAKPAETQAPPK